MSMSVLCGWFVAALVAVAPVATDGPAPLQSANTNATVEAEESKAKLRPVVKIEIKLESGQVIKKSGEVLDWNTNQAVVLDGEGHSHQVSLSVKKLDKKARKLKVKVAYKRDSEPIIAPYTYRSKAKKREILRADGGLALAITVTPKKVSNKRKSRDDSIEQPKDPDDPLGGLE